MVALKNLKITIIEFIVMKNVNVLILRLYYIPIYLNLKFIIIIHDLTRYIFHITMYVYACSWLLTTVWMTCFDGFWASQQRKSVISVDGVVIHFTGIFQGDLKYSELLVTILKTETITIKPYFCGPRPLLFPF